MNRSQFIKNIIGTCLVFIGITQGLKANSESPNLGDNPILRKGLLIQDIVSGDFSEIKSWNKRDEKHKGHDTYFVELVNFIEQFQNPKPQVPETMIPFSRGFYIEGHHGKTLVCVEETGIAGTFIASFGKITGVDKKTMDSFYQEFKRTKFAHLK